MVAERAFAALCRTGQNELLLPSAASHRNGWKHHNTAFIEADLSLWHLLDEQFLEANAALLGWILYSWSQSKRRDATGGAHEPLSLLNKLARFMSPSTKIGRLRDLSQRLFCPQVRHTFRAQQTSGLGFGPFAQLECPVSGNRAAPPRTNP